MLPRIISACTETDLKKGNIIFTKLDIKDGFWCLVYKEGMEWNFAHVLSNPPGEPVEIMVPSALQMGLVFSSPFFCATLETTRDVVKSYGDEPVGALSPHPLGDMTMPPVALPELP